MLHAGRGGEGDEEEAGVEEEAAEEIGYEDSRPERCISRMINPRVPNQNGVSQA